MGLRSLSSLETAIWFETLLAQHGIEASIRQLTCTQISGGLMGSAVRYQFEYEKGEQDNAPNSLIVKFPSEDRQTLSSQGVLEAYEKEIQFYTQFHHVAQQIAPKLWFAHTYNGRAEDFILVLEDLTPLVASKLVDGCSYSQAKSAVEAAAKLHASHWNDPSLSEESWLAGGVKVLPADIMTTCWAEFQRRFSGVLTMEELTLGHQFLASFDQWRLGLEDAPQCLVHRDFRLENVLFPAKAQDRTIAIVDWQLVAQEAAPIDIAFFIGTSVDIENQSKWESDLLAHYHATLVANGVTDYPMSSFMEHYAWYSFWGLNVSVGSMMFARNLEGDAMLLAMYRRASALILANAFADALPRRRA